MYKKKNFIFVVMFIFLFLSGKCFSDVSANLDKAKSDAVSLIESGKYAEAQRNVRQLINQFSGNQDLPEALYWIAQKYGWAEKHEEEKSIYEIILQKYNTSPYAGRAKLGLAKANIQSLVASRDFYGANAALDKLSAEFSGNPDLPEVLYWIAERCEWSDGYKQANDIRRQIIQKYPSSPFAARAKLGFARANVLSLIKSQDYDGAKAALDKLVSDFSKHPDLPDTLYWIARKYGWSEKHEEEKAVYQQILQNYPGSSCESKAKIGFARANVQSLIISQDYDGAQKALDKLVSDFAGNPELQNTLYWVAERYEWSGGYRQANEVHQQIIRNCPNSPLAGKARLGIARVRVSSLMTLKDSNEANKALDKMIADYSKNPDLPRTVLIIGEECYNEGLSKQNQGLNAQAKERFEKAAKIWDKLMNELPASSLTPEVCYQVGDLYLKIGKYKESTRCFQKVVDNYPNYEMVWDAQFRAGYVYEQMLTAGQISESQAGPLIASAYKAVLAKYPDCKAAGAAQSWLAVHGEYAISDANKIDVNDVNAVH